jgi:S1-C subfamily serine protease
MSVAMLFLCPGFVPTLGAADSSVASVLKTTQALVDIQSVNATVVAGQPQGYVNGATGEVYISQRLMPVSYTRSGSGVIIDPAGIIVTNAHTVSGAGGLAVTLFNGQIAPVKEAHLVPGTDIAFLRIDPPFALASIPLGNSDEATTGMNVYTIGHSDFLKGTLIGGKIMGIQWENQAGVNHATAIQMNFDMAKGDSGCPILDGKGRLLGMVGASLTGSGGTTLAIPSYAIAVGYKDFRKVLDKG